MNKFNWNILEWKLLGKKNGAFGLSVKNTRTISIFGLFFCLFYFYFNFVQTWMIAQYYDLFSFTMVLLIFMVLLKEAI